MPVPPLYEIAAIARCLRIATARNFGKFRHAAIPHTVVR
jgi:hypothetical protein